QGSSGPAENWSVRRNPAGPPQGYLAPNGGVPSRRRQAGRRSRPSVAHPPVGGEALEPFRHGGDPGTRVITVAGSKGLRLVPAADRVGGVDPLALVADSEHGCTAW